jgi:hypothetical protein
MGRGRIQKTSFQQLLAEESKRFKEAAEKAPPGSMARELLLRRARRAETASHLNEWLSSPGWPHPSERILSLHHRDAGHFARATNAPMTAKRLCGQSNC